MTARARQNFTPVRLTCPYCGTAHFKKATHCGGEYCKRSCYLSMPFPLMPWIKPVDVARAYRVYADLAGAAEALGVSYPAMRRATVKMGLRSKR